MRDPLGPRGHVVAGQVGLAQGLFVCSKEERHPGVNISHFVNIIRSSILTIQNITAAAALHQPHAVARRPQLVLCKGVHAREEPALLALGRRARDAFQLQGQILIEREHAESRGQGRFEARKSTSISSIYWHSNSVLFWPAERAKAHSSMLGPLICCMHAH